MFVSLLILASLCNLANGEAVNIDVCNVPVPVMAAIVQRPSVPVENCQDRDVPACYEIFRHDDDPGQFGMILMNNRME